MLTRREFDALPDYSCSLPTGTTVGKRWKKSNVYFRGRDITAPLVWHMGEYVESYIPGQIGIEWSLIIDPPDVFVPPLQSANAGKALTDTDRPEERQKQKQ
jgi:hypothetical protein